MVSSFVICQPFCRNTRLLVWDVCAPRSQRPSELLRRSVLCTQSILYTQPIFHTPPECWQNLLRQVMPFPLLHASFGSVRIFSTPTPFVQGVLLWTGSCLCYLRGTARAAGELSKLFLLALREVSSSSGTCKSPVLEEQLLPLAPNVQVPVLLEHLQTARS